MYSSLLSSPLLSSLLLFSTHLFRTHFYFYQYLLFYLLSTLVSLPPSLPLSLSLSLSLSSQLFSNLLCSSLPFPTLVCSTLLDMSELGNLSELPFMTGWLGVIPLICYIIIWSIKELCFKHVFGAHTPQPNNMHLRANVPAHGSFQAQKSEITGMCTLLVTIWNVPLEYYIIILYKTSTISMYPLEYNMILENRQHQQPSIHACDRQ